ncbi:MAG: hypothetical protein F6K35_27295 [Okeania sp. SIO2H7]|nr:hypothetical protein [Okeania sp. SIO2H7]
MNVEFIEEVVETKKRYIAILNGLSKIKLRVGTSLPEDDGRVDFDLINS